MSKLFRNFYSCYTYKGVASKEGRLSVNFTSFTFELYNFWVMTLRSTFDILIRSLESYQNDKRMNEGDKYEQ